MSDSLEDLQYGEHWGEKCWSMGPESDWCGEHESPLNVPDPNDPELLICQFVAAAGSYFVKPFTMHSYDHPAPCQFAGFGVEGGLNRCKCSCGWTAESDEAQAVVDSWRQHGRDAS